MDKSFSERVVEVVCDIPSGRVMTYGDVVKAAGGNAPVLARSVTHILSKSGEKDLPYHRVVYADGRVWIDSSNRKKRLAMYKKEGIEVNEKGRIENFGDIRIHIDE